MPSPPHTCPPEFRCQLIERVRVGRTPDALAQEPSAQTIRNTVHQAERDTGQRAGGRTAAEHEELTRLKWDNRQLKLEREMLAKATARFARETGTIPSSGSGS